MSRWQQRSKKQVSHRLNRLLKNSLEVKARVELAFEWLEKAAEARDPLLCYLKVGPIYDPIRNDPRYACLLHRIGLAKEEFDSKVPTVTHKSSSVRVAP